MSGSPVVSHPYSLAAQCGSELIGTCFVSLGPKLGSLCLAGLLSAARSQPIHNCMNSYIVTVSRAAVAMGKG
jgi:hypothetical protein